MPEFETTTYDEAESRLMYSAEVREIISDKPVWIVRNGIMLFLLIICLMLGLTFFISYPDVVIANAIIVPVNGPKPVVTKTGGRLIKLFKTDGDSCAEGNIIAFLESTGNHEEVIKLSQLIDTLQLFTDDNKIEVIPRLFLQSQNSFTHLGELQTGYRNFSESFLNFTNYLSNGFYIKKKMMLQTDINNAKKLNSNLQIQKSLNEKDLSLTQKTHDAQQSLNDEKIISDYDMRIEESKLTGKKMTIPQIDASLINNENQQNALTKEILELDNQIIQQKKIFVQALNNFKASLEEWKAKYIVTSPVSGRINFTGFLQENQQIPQGNIICYVVPGNTHYFCELNLAQTNFGKVKPGQQVLLKFQSFPYEEFGTVKGKIDLIKNIPSDSGYLSKVILPEGLLTNYNRQLNFTNGMKARAEIITENLQLNQRLFNGLRKLIDK